MPPPTPTNATHPGHLVSMSCTSRDGSEREVFQTGEPMRVRISYTATVEQPDPICELDIERHDGRTATHLFGDLLQCGACPRVSLVLESDHGSLMIMVSDRPHERDDRASVRLGDDPLKVSDTDRLVSDLGVHDGARENAVGHIHILPHYRERCPECAMPLGKRCDELMTSAFRATSVKGSTTSPSRVTWRARTHPRPNSSPNPNEQGAKP